MFPKLAPDYSLHAPTDNDILAILDLLRAHDLEETSDPDSYAPDDIRNDWAHLKRETDSWVVIAPDGLLCGYATVTQDGADHVSEDAYVHPLYQGRGIGSILLDVMEERARQLARLSPVSQPMRVENNIIASSVGARSLLERYGYTLAHVYFRMHITLDAPPPLPQWPAGIVVRVCDGSHTTLQRAHAVIEDAFQDHFAHKPQTYEEWARRHASRGIDPALWLFAFADDQIVGAALGRVQEPGRGWIDMVGVRRAWRKRGIAMALLRQLFGAFYTRGVTRVGLGVDGQSLTGAQHLYERAGMAVTLHIGTYEKSLAT